MYDFNFLNYHIVNCLQSVNLNTCTDLCDHNHKQDTEQLCGPKTFHTLSFVAMPSHHPQPLETTGLVAVPVGMSVT